MPDKIQPALSTSIVFSNVPHALLATKPLPRQKYTLAPGDKDLYALLKNFISTDEVRPGMTGIFFDERLIACTDGHALLTMPNASKHRGLYKPNGKEIDERFPDYLEAIPSESKCSDPVPVNLRALRSYLLATDAFTNSVTHSVPMLIGKDKWAWFNAEAVIDCLRFFERLGYKTAYARFNSVGKDPKNTQLYQLILTGKPDQWYDEGPLLLQMSQMTVAHEPGEYFPCNLDYSYELRAYWSFALNNMVAPGSAKKPQFNEAWDIWNHDQLPSDLLKPHVFKAIRQINTKHSLNQDAVQVAGDVVIARDFRTAYEHKNDILKWLPDGIYRVWGNALLPEAQDDLVGFRYREPVSNVVTSSVEAELLAGMDEFCSEDVLKGRMNNVYLGAEKEHVVTVASDGLIMAKRRGGLVDDDPKALLTPQMVKTIAAIGGKGVVLSHTKGVHWTNYMDTVYGGYIDEGFVAYQSAIEPEFSQCRTFNRKALQAEIDALPKLQKFDKWILGFRGSVGSFVAVTPSKIKGSDDYNIIAGYEPIPVKTPLTFQTERYQTPDTITLVMPFRLPGHDKANDLSFDTLLFKRGLNGSTDQLLSLLSDKYNRPAVLIATDAPAPASGPSTKRQKVIAPRPDPKLALRAKALVLVLRLRQRQA